MIARDRPLVARQGMKGRQMRWVICALVVLGIAPPAFAQDFDILRGAQSVGPATFANWSGFYAGGQAAYGGGVGNFNNASNSLLAYALRETEIESVADVSAWPLIGNASGSSPSYGAFVGYNSQWQNIVLGAEIDYSHVNMVFTAPSTPISGLTYFSQTLGGNQENEYLINATGSAALHLTDYASLRARAGWIFDDKFLPYGFAGFVVARGSYSESAGIDGEIVTTQFNGVSTPQPVLNFCPFPTNAYIASVPQTCQTFGTQDSSGGTSYMYGFDAGLGIDFAVTQNLFLRGEFEYVHIFPLHDITADIAQARVGVGYKF
jgi:outer membrane immunogenic protein